MTDVEISFVMLAKNEESRIEEAIKAVLQCNSLKIELIVIDDGSNDGTYDLVKRFSDADTRLRVYKNKYVGKVLGTNYGYELTSGHLIKFIDADDVLLPNFFHEIRKVLPGQSHCHNAKIVSSNLKHITNYVVNPLIVKGSLDVVVSNLISLPKWSWTFSREVANNIFPIPENMPIEDLWISIRAKEFSSKILITQEPCYQYRQHYGQDYGGILNFSYEIILIRARRSLQAIQILENYDGYSKYNFSYLRKQLELIFSRPNFLVFIRSNLCAKEKIKLALMLYAPRIAKYALIIKWRCDYYKIRKSY